MAALVGERHQQRAANARLQVLFCEARLAAAEHGRERRLVCRHHRLDRHHVELDAEVVRERLCVLEAVVAAVARRHRDARDVVLAERVDCQRRNDGGVDSARQSNHGAWQAELLRVVANALHDRTAVHLGRGPFDELLSPRKMLLRFDDVHRLFPLHRHEREAVLRHRERAAIELQRDIAADEVGIQHRHRVATCSERDHAAAERILAEVPRRRAEVDDKLRAGAHDLLHGVDRILPLREELLVVPAVFADHDANAHACVLDDVLLGLAPRLEVTAFVEHVVRRQQALARDDARLAAKEPRRGVVQRATTSRARMLVGCDAAEQHGQILRHRRREALQRAIVGAQELGPHEQVFWRVAAERELREHRELRALLLRPLRKRDDARAVAGEVADGGVDLAQRDAHRMTPFSALREAG